MNAGNTVRSRDSLSLWAFMTPRPGCRAVTGSPFRRCDVFLWNGCRCLWRACSRAWIFNLWCSSVLAGWISLQLDLSCQVKKQDTQRSHTPTFIFSLHNQKLYCSAASTFITSDCPAVTLRHWTCPNVELVNHVCCLSCWDQGICKSSLLFFSPSPSSLSLFVPRTREKFSSGEKQSSENKFETSCWAISEGKGTGGTVLSNNICAIHSAWDGRGGRNYALMEGGWRRGRLQWGGGWNPRDGCFLLSFHCSKRQIMAEILMLYYCLLFTWQA